MKLGEAEAEIRAALERLRAMPESAHPYVVVIAVGDRWTGNEGPFVQFAGSDTRKLMLDVPLVEQCLSPWTGQYSPTWVKRARPTEWGFMVPDVEPEEGARLAVSLLADGFGVGATELVDVRECADGKGVA